MTLDKPFQDLTEDDLAQLVESAIPEGRQLDFKRQLPSSSDADKKEFLADLTSFANGTGGYIIFGLDETDGTASSLPGLAGIDVEHEILRLESLARDCISPRILGLSLRAIPLSEGRCSLIIKVPRSLLAPHMVSFKGSSRFYGRTSAGKYQMDVIEIRQAFLMTEAIVEKARSRRGECLAKIASGGSPYVLHVGPIIALHILPLLSQQHSSTVHIPAVMDRWHTLPLIYGGASDYRVNLDGLVVSFTLRDNTTGAYTQLYRDGMIEAVNSYLLEPRQDGRKLIPAITFEQKVIEASDASLRFLRSLDLQPPICLFLSLLDVRGYIMGVGDAAAFSAPRAYLREIDRDNLLLPEVIIDPYPDSAARSLRPAFDALWNAAGWPASRNYDEAGDWHI
jgi:hypothetical protein